MKTISKLFILLAVLGIYSSCSNELEMSDSDIDYKEGIEVPIMFSGDVIQQSEEIMTRGATSSDDLIGIQVYRRTEGSTGSWSAFANGLFDHLDNLSVYLLKGYEYKVVATLVKNGKNVLYKTDSYGYGKYYPFYYGIGYSRSVFATNRLEISTSCAMSYLDNCSASLTGSSTRIYDYPQIDRLYGQIEGITPSLNTSINLDLKRVSFGTSCSVSGLEEGTLSVKVSNSSKTFYYSTKLSNGYSSDVSFWTFTNMVSGAYQHWNSYYETLTVSVSHTHDIIGITEDLGSVDIKVYRNKVNNIKINLNATTTRSSFTNNKMKIVVEQEDVL